MDDYAREIMDLKTLVTRTLEKKGVLAKIRAELRSSVFEAIEEEDRVIENEDSGLPPAFLGSCNDRAKQLHASSIGRLLTALVCEYLDWAQLGHTLKVYAPECNVEKDFWQAELQEFNSKNGFDMNMNSESKPMLLDVLESFLKSENLLQISGGRKLSTSEADTVFNGEARNARRPSSSSIVGGLAQLGRPGQTSQSSDRRLGSSVPNFRKDEYNWRSDNNLSEDLVRASKALENIQLGRKAHNLSTTWRHASDVVVEDDHRVDH